MSTAIDANNQTVPTPIDKSKDDPIKLCCSVPPNTDPGPIKP
jgi:hypothetical protein